MTNLQTVALLEAIKIITEKAKDTKEVNEAIERIKEAIKKGVTEADQATR